MMSPPPAWGLCCAVVLITVARVVPPIARVDVLAGTFPPLLADWRPRIGPGTAPALVLAAAVSLCPLHRITGLSWGKLLFACYAAGVAWMTSLALVDGTAGIAQVLENKDEYLRTARGITDVGAMLHQYVSRIPTGSAQWPVHVAGHPPGALLFFIGLVHLGLGSGLAAGLVVILVAATTPMAVAVTLRCLGVERQARAALPFLVLGPSAIWQAVSADALFAAVVASGIAALAIAAVRRRPAWSLLSGLLLGYGVLLSYGLALAAVLVIAVLLVTRTWRPAVVVGAAGAAVVGLFAWQGFDWWAALPALHQRYWSGIASGRPNWYWVWADVAALLCCAGPVLGAALASGSRELRAAVRQPSRHTVATLVAAAVTMTALADLSLMSKAEVERIWLPFVPWLLISTCWLPRSWARPALIGQVVFALLVQHLLWSRW